MGHDAYDTRLMAFGVVTDPQRRLLVGRGAPTDPFNLPGDYVAVGERFSDTVIRAITEATGAQARVLRLLGSEMEDHGSGRTAMLIYRAQLTQDAGQLPEGMRWVALSELALLPTHPTVGIGLEASGLAARSRVAIEPAVWGDAPRLLSLRKHVEDWMARHGIVQWERNSRTLNGYRRSLAVGQWYVVRHTADHLAGAIRADGESAMPMPSTSTT